MREEDTAVEKELKKENERWKDYANALLIAIPVLLAGLALSDPKKEYAILSAVFGILAIGLVVIWYGRDSNVNRWTPGGRYPSFLFYATCFFGVQMTFLTFAIVTQGL